MSARRRNPALDRWTARSLYALEYAALCLTRAVVAPLPPRLRIRFGGWLGRMIVPGLPATRRRVGRNLLRALPGADAAERARIARAVGDNFGRVLAEYECLDRIAGDGGRAALSGPGLAALAAARAEGRGAVLVSAHFGNWEAIRFALKQQGTPCAMIYRAFNNPWFDRDVRAKMLHAGEPVLTKGRQGMRAFVTHVAKGGVALILVDQKQTGAPLVSFLGLPAETAPAAAELASRCGVPLIPAFATRRADGLSFDVELEAPVPEGEPIARMAEVNERIGARIRARPEQWFWLHNRWRGG
ncbi:MAG TPA: acyltransferase [Paracoccaceae bacterium]|nr:acyltransferase [Paracoccaceae bacterium]